MRKLKSTRSLVLGSLICCCFFLFQPVLGQNTPMKQGTVERIKVHGKGLEGNLSGDSPDREVSIYLPPSYKTNPKRRYPVVYLLHGFTDNDAQWYGFQTHWINLPNVVNKALASGQLHEMILVTPNAYTRFQGSFYSNSVTTGNWEDYVAKELVANIDKNYRTIPQASSRGIAGHSMGGYGAFRIGQKYPEIFSSVYLLSPCCLSPSENELQNLNNLSRLENIHTPEEVNKADFLTRAAFATGAAWAPNPKKPPFYLDLPTDKGQVQPLIVAKRMANMPIATLDQNITNVKKLTAIGFDAGTQDTNIAASIQVLDQQLNKYGIKHSFEIYEGDHVNRVAERIETKMLGFFSDNLSFEAKKVK
ncbi:esterase [Adhaeribacter arboris]|uniref:Esterase n=1 Tax=Adhaeribacter arboris TaxID=2072846 RepID=A0A2T2YCB3_9BACT|nr:alpha/beta hydrolase-fold protein [Adhaeribacter arboris]PSR53126.1 esterase [Adhaeribacter arboris]